MSALIQTIWGKKIIRFGLMGLVATLSHYAVMFIGLMFWQLPTVWSFLGASTGAVVGYLLNYTFTFESDQPHIQTSWRYFVITLLSIFINTSVFFLLSRVVDLDVLIAQLISTIFVFVCNYWLHKHITFHGSQTEIT